MIRVAFRLSNRGITGFEISGHSGFAASGKDIVCAAVSSAAYMALNTVVDVCKAKATVEAREGRMALDVAGADIERCRDILTGLRLHLTQLGKQYPEYIRVTTSEV